jgi:hypothetical protein
MNQIIQKPEGFEWDAGTLLKKKRGGQWHGKVVGFYSTSLTAEGYAVESTREPGSVQLYPKDALELWDPLFN